MRKHILMVVENLSVPFDRRVWRESRSLHKAGYDVSVICPKGTTYDTESFVEREGVRIYRYRLPVEGVSSHRRLSVGTYLIEYSYSLLMSAFLAIRIYARKRFHVVHVANPPDLFFLLGWLFKPLGVRFIFDHHDLNPEFYLAKQQVPKKDFFYRVLLRLERWSFRTADLVISTNESYKEIALKRGGKDPSEVFVVRNGPERHHFKPTLPDESLRASHRYLVGYIGVMSKTDGVDNVLRVAHEIVYRRNRKEVGFLLIGSGPSTPELMEMSRALEIEPWVTFTGRVPDEEVIRILSTVDVCVAPDPPNGANELCTMNKIMDYLAFGKPIVSFDLKETRISAGDAAVYVQDEREMGEALLALLDDPERRRRMSEKALQRISRLCWEESERVLLQAYDCLWKKTE